jgi:hypothetical protein
MTKIILIGALLFTYILFFTACGTSSSTPIEFEPVDVTWVFPLPNSRDETFDIKAETQANHGAILPREIFDTLPRLTRTDTLDDLYHSLSVVAVRLDTHFQEGFGDKAVVRETIRLVLQPVFYDEHRGLWSVRDAAVHAFYQVDKQDILALAHKSAEMRIRTPYVSNGTVTVHPLWKDKESTSEMASELKEALLELIGEEKLIRLTVVSVHGENEAWNFSGIERRNVESVWEDITIPNTESTMQHFLSTGGRDCFSASATPMSDMNETLQKLMSETCDGSAGGHTHEETAENQNNEYTDDEIHAAVHEVAKLTNPNNQNPGTTDCISCHVSESLLRRNLDGHVDDDTKTYLYKLPQGASPQPSSMFINTQNIRFLGYRDAELSIAPRVQAESFETIFHMKVL